MTPCTAPGEPLTRRLAPRAEASKHRRQSASEIINRRIGKRGPQQARRGETQSAKLSADGDVEVEASGKSPDAKGP